MRVSVIIPARYSSTRFPGKPLVKLLGKPMILWVAELSAEAVGKENVYVATDDARISSVVIDAGFTSILTSKDALTGTDRVSEAAEQIKSDIYINVQGDEPIINPNDIKKIISIKKKNMQMVVNGYCWLDQDEDPTSLNIPKVITNENNKLLYMSRMKLPGAKDDSVASIRYKKQVCIYAFTAEELEAFRGFGRKSELESFEDIEILRFFELNKDVYMVETMAGSLAIDVKEDIERVEKALKEQ